VAVRVVQGSVVVPDLGGGDAVDLHERMLDAPETAGCEGGLLGHVVISSLYVDVGIMDPRASDSLPACRFGSNPAHIRRRGSAPPPRPAAARRRAARRR